MYGNFPCLMTAAALLWQLKRLAIPQSNTHVREQKLKINLYNRVIFHSVFNFIGIC